MGIVNKKLAGKSLIESNIRQETGCTVVAIKCKDDGMVVSPKPERVLELNQDIILIGSAQGEMQFSRKYENGNGNS